MLLRKDKMVENSYIYIFEMSIVIQKETSGKIETPF